MVVDAENRIRLSPQIALVVRSFWPCRRFAVDIGVNMLMKKIKRLCQRRWHRRETVFQYMHVFWTTCSHAGTGLSRTSLPASPRFGFGKFFGNRCREQPQVLGRKGFASTCRYMQHEWFGCPAQLQGTRELCQPPKSIEVVEARKGRSNSLEQQPFKVWSLLEHYRTPRGLFGRPPMM
jgi:hypothetical protein